MEARNLSQHNLYKARKSVKAEVNKLGEQRVFYRPKYIPDGMNGATRDTDGDTIIADKMSMLINLSSSNVTEVTVEGGRKYDITANCIVPYEEGLVFQRFDWFEDSRNVYEVIGAVNVDELNVYWLLQLSVVPKEVNGYG